jgi:hypothetical protein
MHAELLARLGITDVLRPAVRQGKLPGWWFASETGKCTVSMSVRCGGHAKGTALGWSSSMSLAALRSPREKERAE